MGIAFRFFIIGENDELMRISYARYKRLSAGKPRDRMPEFAGRRIRWAQIAVEMEDRKPLRVVWTFFGYLPFDQRGGLDEEQIRKSAALSLETLIGPMTAKIRPKFFKEEPGNVLHSAWRFAARRRDHEERWKPSLELNARICDAAIGAATCRRV